MKRLHFCQLLVVLAGIGTPARAQMPIARVGDVTHLQGQGVNTLIGYGLVTGLAGSGDGAKFKPTMRAVAAMLQRFGTEIESLKDVESAKNVALVSLSVVVPEHGVREGELLDVAVTALAAKSLEGGRLLATPLVYHDRGVETLFGFAAGAVFVSASVPTSGIIRHGARMERDVMMDVVATGAELRSTGMSHGWIKADETYVTVVLDDAHAGWAMAAAIAQAVDKELSVSADVERVALALDSKNIVILVPRHQRGDIASWIRDIERTPILMESNETRVTINRRTGTIVVTGDTRISPVVISQAGLTVTVANPLADGTVPVQPFEVQRFVALDAAEQRLPNVSDLLEALNRLKVPFAERVSILEEIHRAGKLHARIMYEG